MEEIKDSILHGKISSALFALAIPIVLSNFMQTALGIIDMIWIGKLGSGAVSAIGTASFYVNLATALTTLITIGSGVKIAHSIGSERRNDSKEYIKNGIVLSLVLSIVFVLIVSINSNELIGFFGMNDLYIETMARDYLITSLYGVPLLFMITFLITVFTSYGNTKITFKANSIGLLLNIVLDPIMIFGFFMIPKMGVSGAAWATTISRLVTLLILLFNMNSDMKKAITKRFNLKKMREVIRMSLPVTVQRLVFIIISMTMAKIIVQFGNEAIAVQKIGLQIESISYVTIGGLQGAISAFIGQNYGNKNVKRIVEGYSISMRMVLVFGLIVSFFFIAFPKQIFSIFIQETEIINGGVGYMRAIGFSQLFMCVELLTVGAFNGIGRTYIPPLVSISLTVIRIPLAIFLSNRIGLSGVWWSISISSILKGITLYLWFNFELRKKEGLIKFA